jgi:hypothetical protein
MKDAMLDQIVHVATLIFAALQVVSIAWGIVVDSFIPRDPRFEGEHLWYRS